MDKVIITVVGKDTVGIMQRYVHILRTIKLTSLIFADHRSGVFQYDDDRGRKRRKRSSMNGFRSRRDRRWNRRQHQVPA